MQAAFIITSALVTGHGVFTPEQRLAQSLQTLASVQAHAPHARIVWVEMAAHPLPVDFKRALLAQVHYLIDYQADPFVQAIYRDSPSADVVKNLTEMHCFAAAVAQAQQAGWLADVQRVFKLSGRYQLAPPFDLAWYARPEVAGRCVFRQALPSQFPPELTGGAAWQYMSRLWSFDARTADQVPARFAHMRQAMLARLQAGGYIDIEHLLHAHTPADQCLGLPRIGVVGPLGPTGQLVAD